jgi:hypothetical protein
MLADYVLNVAKSLLEVRTSVTELNPHGFRPVHGVFETLREAFVVLQRPEQGIHLVFVGRDQGWVMG